MPALQARDPDHQRIEDALGKLLGEAFDLEEVTLLHIRDEWDRVEPWKRTQAWKHVRCALKATHREELMNDARDAVTQWVNSSWIRPDRLDELVARTGRIDARMNAAPVILDAAAQVIVGDQLDPEDRPVLAHPFATRPGKPSAPPTEQDEIEADRRRFWG